MQSSAISRTRRDGGELVAMVIVAGLIAISTPTSASDEHAPEGRLSRLAGTHHSNLDHSGKAQTGVASFYGTHGAKRLTASGDLMDPGKLTAASRTLPLGTTAQVANTDNGKTAVVKITDRGPVSKARVLDVSPKAAAQLGMINDGVAHVKVTPLVEPQSP
jgi:rare lipoprotein A